MVSMKDTNSVLIASKLTQILRFRSKKGTLRAEAQPTDLFDVAFQKLTEDLPDIDPATITLATSPTGKQEPASRLLGKTVQKLGLNHGDMLFVSYTDSAAAAPAVEAVTAETAPQMTAAHIRDATKQLPVDDFLEKQDGKIKRQLSALQQRKFGNRGMGEDTLPVDPWDEEYLKEQKIKHMSYHAYVKKLNSQANKKNGGGYIAPLNVSDFGVSKSCTGAHAPWPEGICSRCQPSAITLQSQPFRMVDHVEFAESGMINSFIEPWRQSGTQRIGWMYGHYEPYELVPLGIKAVVEAIYEPAQSGEYDGITITEITQADGQPQPPHIATAEACGLVPLGVVFTDLVDSGNGDGSVICKRHADSYFLSSLEVAFAGAMQARFPNKSRWSPTSEFSSKFVTAVISGNPKGEIDVQCYQVSEQCEAMARADLIEPSINPSVLLVKEATKTRYVPDVFYKKNNEYGRTVLQGANPQLPVDYMLVTLTHGFPQDPKPLFSSGLSSFPVENRELIGVTQSPQALGKALDSGSAGGAVSNFHLLSYIQSMGVLSAEEFQLLAKVATEKKDEDVSRLVASEGWNNLLLIIQ